MLINQNHSTRKLSFKKVKLDINSIKDFPDLQYLKLSLLKAQPVLNTVTQGKEVKLSVVNNNYIYTSFNGKEPEYCADISGLNRKTAKSNSETVKSQPDLISIFSDFLIDQVDYVVKQEKISDLIKAGKIDENLLHTEYCKKTDEARRNMDIAQLKEVYA